MSDVAAAEAPAERVPPVPPVQEVTETPSAACPEPILPEIGHAIGKVRQGILDHLVDTAPEPQTVAQFLAAMPPGTTRGNVEAAIRREHESGRIERIAPGTYVLAAPKQVDPPKPAPSQPEPVRSDGHTAEEWFAAFEAYMVDPASWDAEKFGPSVDQPGHRIPRDIALRFSERLRRREERRRDREAAAARQAAADRELHGRLLAATYGNHSPELAAGGDLSAIRTALELIPLESVLHSIRMKTDKRIYPPNEPATSWRERRLLKKIAEDYCQSILVPSMVAAWEAAGKAGGKAADTRKASPATPLA
jgi:hypothetical protein